MTDPKKLELYQALCERERRRCMRDKRYFIETYVKIEDRDAAELAIPFTLWDGQAGALDTIDENRLTIILKARQLGLTWLALAYAVHGIVFNPGYAVVALSKRDDDAKELTRRITFILRHLPDFFIRHKKDQRVIVDTPLWDNTTSAVTLKHPDGEPSHFTSMTSSPDSGRSFTASLVLLDEWAFQQFAREIWAAAYPTINRPTGGKVIGLSTAKRGTLFEDIWNQGSKGDNSFATVFLDWQTDPRRDLEWYEATRKTLGDAIHAEYPSNPTEAFTFAEASVFNVEAVTARIQLLRDRYKKTPPLKVDITCKHTPTGDPVKGTERIEVNPKGFLTIYKEPDYTRPYVIAGDTAEGGADYSVLQVLDNITGEQVAVWRGRADTDILAKQAYSLGYYYNKALIGIETNFDLHPVKELERLNYPRQYQRESIDNITNKISKKHGFRTTKQTRGPIIDDLKYIARSHIELINDIPTLEEMLTFVRNDNGKAEALDGYHDDRIMSLAIAHAIRDQHISRVITKTDIEDRKKKRRKRTAPVVSSITGY